MVLYMLSDITLDVDTLTVDQMVQLNQCGVQFGMGEDDYVRSVSFRDRNVTLINKCVCCLSIIG